MDDSGFLPKLFEGNVDDTNVAVLTLPDVIITEKLIIHVGLQERLARLRVQVLGCYERVTTTAQPQSTQPHIVTVTPTGPVGSTTIPAAPSTEHPQQTTPHVCQKILPLDLPEDSKLPFDSSPDAEGVYGWAPPSDVSLLKVDLLEPMIVTGLNILGGGADSDAFVESLAIMYVSPSMPGINQQVSSPEGQLSYPGNDDDSTVKTVILSTPVYASSLTIRVINTNNKDIRLRLQVLGCEHEVTTSVPRTTSSAVQTEGPTTPYVCKEIIPLDLPEDSKLPFDSSPDAEGVYGWAPASDVNLLKVDLLEPMIVTGLNILGGGADSDAFVESLAIMYVSPSMPGINQQVSPPEGQLSYLGNDDASTVKTVMLSEPVYASSLTLRVLNTDNNNIRLRLEVLGCAHEGTTIRPVMTTQPHIQLTTGAELTTPHVCKEIIPLDLPEDSKLPFDSSPDAEGVYGWAPPSDVSLLKVDLLEPMIVTGLNILGGGADYNAFVESLVIMYVSPSMPGINQQVSPPDGQLSYPGNDDASTVKTVMLSEPVYASSLTLRVFNTDNKNIRLRLQVLGCEHEVTTSVPRTTSSAVQTEGPTTPHVCKEIIPLDLPEDSKLSFDSSPDAEGVYGWAPASDVNLLKVDLLEPMIVTGLNILGGGADSDAFVESLAIMYVSPSMPGINQQVSPPEGQLSYLGNDDASTVKTVMLSEPVYASSLTLRVLNTDNNNIRLRLEVLGCAHEGTTIRPVMTTQPHIQLTTGAELTTPHVCKEIIPLDLPEDSKLPFDSSPDAEGVYGWAPPSDVSLLKVDLLEPMIVTGLNILGGGADSDAFVESLVIMYVSPSMPGINQQVSPPDGQLSYPGNDDASTVKTVMLSEPVYVSSLTLRVFNTDNKNIRLRLQVLGCEHEVTTSVPRTTSSAVQTEGPTTPHVCKEIIPLDLPEDSKLPFDSSPDAEGVYGWAPASDVNLLKVDLLEPMIVTGLNILGGGADSDAFVESLVIMYVSPSMPGINQQVSPPDGQLSYPGNDDASTVKTVMLSEPVYASSLTLRVFNTDNTNIRLRLEVLGCAHEGTTIRPATIEPIKSTTGPAAPSTTRPAASSTTGPALGTTGPASGTTGAALSTTGPPEIPTTIAGAPSTAKPVGSTTPHVCQEILPLDLPEDSMLPFESSPDAEGVYGWAPASAGFNLLKVDLLEPMIVTGLNILGGGDGTNAFVENFLVMYVSPSKPGEALQVSPPEGQSSYPGNDDDSTVKTVILSTPVVATSLTIRILNINNNDVRLRLQVLGCEHEGTTPAQPEVTTPAEGTTSRSPVVTSRKPTTPNATPHVPVTSVTPSVCDKPLELSADTDPKLLIDSSPDQSGLYGWTPVNGDTLVSLELASPETVTAIILMGGGANSIAFVERFTMMYSTPDAPGALHTIPGLFTGNTDGITPVTVSLPSPVYASVIMIRIINIEHVIRLRVQLLGCSGPTTAPPQVCQEALPFQTINPEAYLDGTPDVNNVYGWTPTDVPFIVAQLATESYVTAILIQGGGPSSNAFVEKFEVVYVDEQGDALKVPPPEGLQYYPGNSDDSTVQLVQLTESVLTSSIIIQPVNELFEVRLRMQPLGCDKEGQTTVVFSTTSGPPSQTTSGIPSVYTTPMLTKPMTTPGGPSHTTTGQPSVFTTKLQTTKKVTPPYNWKTTMAPGTTAAPETTEFKKLTTQYSCDSVIDLGPNNPQEVNFDSEQNEDGTYGWSPARPEYPVLLISLPEVMEITGVIILGGGPGSNAYPEEFQISYLPPNSDKYASIASDASSPQTKTFEGNTNGMDPISISIPEYLGSIYTNAIAFQIFNANVEIRLRIQLLGCDYTVTTPRMTTSQAPTTIMSTTVAVTHGSTTPMIIKTLGPCSEIIELSEASDPRLGFVSQPDQNGIYGWTSSPVEPKLLIDLDSPALVTAFNLMGGGSGSNEYLEAFTLQYRRPGQVDLLDVQTADGQSVFIGNLDELNSVTITLLEPGIEAASLVITPVESSLKPRVRIQVLGCYLDLTTSIPTTSPALGTVTPFAGQTTGAAPGTTTGIPPLGTLTPFPEGQTTGALPSTKAPGTTARVSGSTTGVPPLGTITPFPEGQTTGAVSSTKAPGTTAGISTTGIPPLGTLTPFPEGQTTGAVPSTKAPGTTAGISRSTTGVPPLGTLTPFPEGQTTGAVPSTKAPGTTAGVSGSTTGVPPLGTITPFPEGQTTGAVPSTKARSTTAGLSESTTGAPPLGTITPFPERQTTGAVPSTKAPGTTAGVSGSTTGFPPLGTITPFPQGQTTGAVPSTKAPGTTAGVSGSTTGIPPLGTLTPFPEGQTTGAVPSTKAPGTTAGISRSTTGVPPLGTLTPFPEGQTTGAVSSTKAPGTTAGISTSGIPPLGTLTPFPEGQTTGAVPSTKAPGTTVRVSESTTGVPPLGTITPFPERQTTGAVPSTKAPGTTAGVSGSTTGVPPLGTITPFPEGQTTGAVPSTKAPSTTAGLSESTTGVPPLGTLTPFPEGQTTGAVPTTKAQGTTAGVSGSTTGVPPLGTITPFQEGQTTGAVSSTTVPGTTAGISRSTTGIPPLGTITPFPERQTTGAVPSTKAPGTTAGVSGSTTGVPTLGTITPFPEGQTTGAVPGTKAPGTTAGVSGSTTGIPPLGTLTPLPGQTTGAVPSTKAPSTTARLSESTTGVPPLGTLTPFPEGQTTGAVPTTKAQGTTAGVSGSTTGVPPLGTITPFPEGQTTGTASSTKAPGTTVRVSVPPLGTITPFPERQTTGAVPSTNAPGTTAGVSGSTTGVPPLGTITPFQEGQTTGAVSSTKTRSTTAGLSGSTTGVPTLGTLTPFTEGQTTGAVPSTKAPGTTAGLSGSTTGVPTLGTLTPFPEGQTTGAVPSTKAPGTTAGISRSTTGVPPLGTITPFPERQTTGVVSSTKEPGTTAGVSGSTTGVPPLGTITPFPEGQTTGAVPSTKAPSTTVGVSGSTTGVPPLGTLTPFPEGQTTGAVPSTKAPGTTTGVSGSTTGIPPLGTITPFPEGQTTGAVPSTKARSTTAGVSRSTTGVPPLGTPTPFPEGQTTGAVPSTKAPGTTAEVSGSTTGVPPLGTITPFPEGKTTGAVSSTKAPGTTAVISRSTTGVLPLGTITPFPEGQTTGAVSSTKEPGTTAGVSGSTTGVPPLGTITPFPEGQTTGAVPSTKAPSTTARVSGSTTGVPPLGTLTPFPEGQTTGAVPSTKAPGTTTGVSGSTTGIPPLGTITPFPEGQTTGAVPSTKARSTTAGVSRSTTGVPPLGTLTPFPEGQTTGAVPSTKAPGTTAELSGSTTGVPPLGTITPFPEGKTTGAVSSTKAPGTTAVISRSTTGVPPLGTITPFPEGQTTGAVSSTKEPGTTAGVSGSTTGVPPLGTITPFPERQTTGVVSSTKALGTTAGISRSTTGVPPLGTLTPFPEGQTTRTVPSTKVPATTSSVSTTREQDLTTSILSGERTTLPAKTFKPPTTIESYQTTTKGN
ncbi:uncharacterized protein [Antedon mediterranea]|uniref:uncharacterized protein n=1 Tax=Antedon mediterranea TaxID=105859 RepID=UPI003AF98F21